MVNQEFLKKKPKKQNVNKEDQAYETINLAYKSMEKDNLKFTSPKKSSQGMSQKFTSQASIQKFDNSEKNLNNNSEVNKDKKEGRGARDMLKRFLNNTRSHKIFFLIQLLFYGKDLIICAYSEFLTILVILVDARLIFKIIDYMKFSRSFEFPVVDPFLSSTKTSENVIITDVIRHFENIRDLKLNLGNFLFISSIYIFLRDLLKNKRLAKLNI